MSWEGSPFMALSENWGEEEGECKGGGHMPREVSSDDGEAPHNKVQVAFPVCCGNPIERNQVWGEDKAMQVLSRGG